MNEGTLVTIGLTLCFWVGWLEWRLRRADEKCDQLCHLLVHIAYGRLTIRVDRDRKVHITPTGR
jgi:hypothetical protein